MPTWRVANVYIIRCVHEVEAPNEEEAIRRGMDQKDGLEATVPGRSPGQRLGIRAKYSYTELEEPIEEV